MKKLYPNEYVDSVYHVDYLNLKNKGIQAILFDIDNTLAPFDVAHPTKEVIDHIIYLQKLGFDVALVSNNKENRVIEFNKNLNLTAIHKAGKPKLKGLKKSIHQFKVEHKNVAIIGDQIFTDVWGGNRLGFYTILVKPIGIKDEFTVKLKRGIEKIIIDKYIKKK